MRLIATIVRLLPDQITAIGNEVSIQTSKFENVWSQIKQMCHFHPLEVVSRYRDPQLQVGEN